MLPLVIEELFKYRVDFEKGIYSVMNYGETMADISFSLEKMEEEELSKRVTSLPLSGLPETACIEEGFELPDDSGVLPVFYLQFQWVHQGQTYHVRLDKNCREYSGETGALGHALMELYEASQKMIWAKPVIAAAPKSGTMLL